MRKNFTYKLLTCFALAASLAQADKITLKDGKVIEGEVISETDTEYVISVAYSKSIRTRKTFKKSEIVDIKKEAPDLKPYEALKDVLPTPDQLSVAGYEQLIEGRVKPFLKSFPNSQYGREVNKMLTTLEAELAKVKAGDIRLNGEWIAAEDWNANALELDAQILVKKMEDFAAKRSYRSALLIYDKINLEFRGSDAATEAAKVAGKFIPKYSAQIKALAAVAPEKVAKREKAMKAMSERDASRMKKAYEDADAKHEAALEAAKESRTKWLPVSEFDSRTLSTLAKNLDAELISIERGPSRSTRGESSSVIYRQGWEAAGKGNANEVKRAQSYLRSRKVDNKYLQLLSDHLAANPAAVEDTGPDPEALKAAAAKAAAEKKKAEEAKKKAEEKAKREKQRKAQLEAEEAANAEPEEKSGSSLFPIIIAVVLLGLLITFLVIKRKQSEE